MVADTSIVVSYGAFGINGTCADLVMTLDATFSDGKSLDDRIIVWN